MCIKDRIEHSLNVGAMKAMQAEGHSNFYNNLQGFGLTKPSGIDVAAEDTVAPPAAAQMADAQFATTAFGQGIDVNMVQMLSAAVDDEVASVQFSAVPQYCGAGGERIAGGAGGGFWHGDSADVARGAGGADGRELSPVGAGFAAGGPGG